MKLPRPQITLTRIRIARFLAISADAIQWIMAPLFFEGFLSIFNVILDVGMCISMTMLLGFRVWFLPSFFFEGIPFLDLAPTWTIAVFLATRNGPDLPPVIENYERKN